MQALSSKLRKQKKKKKKNGGGAAVLLGSGIVLKGNKKNVAANKIGWWPIQKDEMETFGCGGSSYVVVIG